jgi:hypothetical protein
VLGSSISVYDDDEGAAEGGWGFCDKCGCIDSAMVLLGGGAAVGLGLRFAMNSFYGYYSRGRDGCLSTTKSPSLIQTIVAQYRVAYLVTLFDVSSAI